jgi:spermidine synthase
MGTVTEFFDSYDDSPEEREPQPYIQEYKGVMRLRFNAFDVQSAMNKKAPDELVLRYTRTMVEALQYKPNPGHIASIGLGGGSVQKYCYRHFPDALISVAEINPDVIALRKHFHIPADSQRFVVHCEDGARFVKRHTQQFDVLLVDGFDNHGQPAQLCSAAFYQDCYRSLTAQGILVVNICDNHQLIPPIRRSFEGQVLLLDDDETCFNTIVVAGKGNILQAGG